MCPPAENARPSSTPSNNPSTPPSCVPDDPRAKAAYTLAATKLNTDLLNHSLRVFLYAKSAAAKESSVWASDPEKLPLLFVSCILHDIGCASDYDGPERFEVQGADAAAALLRDVKVSSQKESADTDIHEVWQGIAIHTSPQIAEKISPFAKFVRTGVLTDFGGFEDVEGVKEMKREREAEFPRLNIEKVLSDTVAEQGVRQRSKAPPGTWPWMLVKSKLENPEWKGVNKAFVG
jgi:hypothetical protein